MIDTLFCLFLKSSKNFNVSLMINSMFDELTEVKYFEEKAEVKSRDAFRTQASIYDEAFFS